MGKHNHHKKPAKRTTDSKVRNIRNCFSEYMKGGKALKAAIPHIQGANKIGLARVSSGSDFNSQVDALQQAGCGYIIKLSMSARVSRDYAMILAFLQEHVVDQGKEVVCTTLDRICRVPELTRELWKLNPTICSRDLTVQVIEGNEETLTRSLMGLYRLTVTKTDDVSKTTTVFPINQAIYQNTDAHWILPQDVKVDFSRVSGPCGFSNKNLKPSALLNMVKFFERDFKELRQATAENRAESLRKLVQRSQCLVYAQEIIWLFFSVNTFVDSSFYVSKTTGEPDYFREHGEIILTTSENRAAIHPPTRSWEECCQILGVEILPFFVDAELGRKVINIFTRTQEVFADPAAHHAHCDNTLMHMIRGRTDLKLQKQAHQLMDTLKLPEEMGTGQYHKFENVSARQTALNLTKVTDQCRSETDNRMGLDMITISLKIGGVLQDVEL